MLEQLSPVLTSTASTVFLVVVVYLFKMPGILKKNTEAIEKLTASVGALTQTVHISEQRHDVSEKIFSDILDHPIDTEQISKDFSKYPQSFVFLQIGKNRRES